MTTPVRALALLMAALAVVAGVVWLLLPPLAAPAAPANAPAELSLPDVPQFDSQAASARLAAAPLWGRLPERTTTPETTLRWRLVASVAARANPFVLISVNGGEPEVRRTGDTLPSGARILRIRTDHVVVSVEGKELQLKVANE